MNSTKNDGGPAFPCPVGHIECYHPIGMSLRDWFAGQIACGDASSEDGWTENMSIIKDYAAKRAAVYYAVADAMITERSKL